jgi:malate dehydrogenase (decarboxylating)
MKDSWFNKGTAFSRSERDRFGLRGLLPPRRLSMQQQTARCLCCAPLSLSASDLFLSVCLSLSVTIFRSDLDHFRNSGMTDIEKFTSLSDLQQRNETLFYKVINDNIKEMAPIVYTPTGSSQPSLCLCLCLPILSLSLSHDLSLFSSLLSRHCLSNL